MSTFKFARAYEERQTQDHVTDKEPCVPPSDEEEDL